MVVKKINSDSLFKASFSNIMDTNLIPYRKISSRCRDYWQKINPPAWQLITSDVNLINFFFKSTMQDAQSFFFPASSSVQHLRHVGHVSSGF